MSESNYTIVNAGDVDNLARLVQEKIDLGLGWRREGLHVWAPDGSHVSQVMVIGEDQTIDGALSYLGDVTASAAELNILDGVTATTSEINQWCDESARNEIVTTTNVIAANESGKTFFLDAAGGFASTLPAPALGLRFTFIIKTAPSGGAYTIPTNGSGNIIRGQQQSAAGDAGDTGTTDDTITFVDGQAVAGDRVDLFCDGTNWFAYAYSKIAAGVTFTTSS